MTFFITDAGYHRSKRESPTAEAEEEFLCAKGVDDTDFYAVFDSVSVAQQLCNCPTEEQAKGRTHVRVDHVIITLVVRPACEALSSFYERIVCGSAFFCGRPGGGSTIYCIAL